jgi:hypothetical protein
MADRASTIHFNLEGMDLQRAYNFTGNPATNPWDITNWEFQQIMNNPAWAGKTQFYNLPLVP